MPLNHVALTVSDRDRAAAFYGDFFDLTEIVYNDEHLLILGSSDGSELALSAGQPVAGDLPRTNHFGFRLANAAAVRSARKRFHQAGIVETEWQDDERFIRAQVLDPDGYRVEVYAQQDR